MSNSDNPEYYRRIGIPIAQISPDGITTAATLEQDSPQPGVPVPASSDISLKLSSSGTMSADKSFDIYTQQAGNPGPGGASFLWKETGDSDSHYRGRDVQQASAWELVQSVLGVTVH